LTPSVSYEHIHSQADKLTEVTMATFGYCRVSTARQATEGESLDVQRRQIEGYAHMHGLVLDKIVVEEGISGSVPVAERPAAGPLFVRLTKGDVVIAPKLDRLFRSALDALKVVEDLKKRGVALHLLDLGGDISGNGLSKLFLTIAAAFAEAERDRIRERIGQVKADQKARGRYLGGKVPFGFRRGESGELIPNEAEHEAIREMVAMRGEGKPLRAIADAVQAKGHQISHEGVAGVLKSIITIICHSNGQFSVGKNMGGFNGSMVFRTREEADAHAKQLQEKAGGPNVAKIVVHDLKREAERPAAR
jgi:DNA invertase Pin-like site-specific DNA recombinase